MERQAVQQIATAYADTFGTSPDVVKGIPSLTDGNPAPPGTGREEVRTLLSELNQQPLQAAVNATFGLSPTAGRARTALFDDAADAWRIPIAERLGGRCLDINTGFGTRAALLGELCETVYATDPSLDALRFLSARTDYSHSDVVPVHTTINELPMPTEPFETITANLVGEYRPDDLKRTVEQLSERLKPGGTLVVVVDGWPRVTGVAPAVGIGNAQQSTRDTISKTRLRTAASASEYHYRSLFAECGFTDLSLYALLPGPVDPSFIFDVSDTAAVRWLLGGQLSSHDRTASAAESVSKLIDRTGLLEQCYPAYLVVGQKPDKQTDHTAETTQNVTTATQGRPWWNDENQLTPMSISAVSTESSPSVAESSNTVETSATSVNTSTPPTKPQWLLTRGSARSVILALEDDTIKRVIKIPHRSAHAQFQLDEHTVLDSVRSTDNQTIRSALPQGQLSDSRFGPVYTEQVVPGTPISAEITTDPNRFASIIRRGLDWITTFQQIYRGKTVEKSPQEVTEQLTVSALDLTPPPIEESVTVFETPVHGDYHPRNVFIEDDTISAVIDWELGSTSGNPIVDPAFYIIQVASTAFNGVRNGLDAIFADSTEHSQIVQEAITTYCNRVGLSTKTFGIYLPAVWIRRLKMCLERGATMSYTGKATRRANHVRSLWEHQQTIFERY